jgi:hypothetical protein
MRVFSSINPISACRAYRSRTPISTCGEPTKTIGHARAGGEKALTAHCLACYHQAVKTLEELKLWNDMIFVDVPQHRRLV